MTDETPTFATTVQVRVLWEGVLFPYAESLTIQDSPQQASCQMRVPESHHLRVDELVGTMLQVFYKNERVEAGDPDVSGASDWPILFQGELAGQSESRNLQHRQKTLRFVGHTRHFKQTKLFFMDPNKRSNGPDTALAKEQAIFMGASKINLDAQGAGIAKKSRIWSQFEQAIGKFEDDEGRNIGFQAVVLHLLRQAKKQYPYLAYIDRKLQLTKRFAAYIDPDVKNLIDLKGLSQMAEGRVESMDGEVSLMQILNIANQILRYNWTQLTQPQLRERGKDNATEEATEEELEGIRQAVRDLQKAVGRNITGKTVVTSVGDITMPGSREGHKRFPADLFVRELETQIEQGSEPREALQSFVTQRQWLPEPRTPDPAGPDKKKGDKTDIAKLLEREQENLQARDELNEFAVVPNMEFAHPPKCNVIMPQNVQGFGMQRNYLQEPTRLLGKMSFMKGNNGQNPQHWYVAPFAQSFHKIEDGNVRGLEDAFKEFTQELSDIQEEG